MGIDEPVNASFVVFYHLPIADEVVLIHTVGGVPAFGQKGDGLVRGKLAGKAVDIVAQIGGDRLALFFDRLLGIVGDRLADRDDCVLFREIDGIELERLFRLAVVQARKIDKARLQLADIFRKTLRRLGEDDQILALGQRLDALLEGLDDTLVVIDGDRIVADQGREELCDDMRQHPPEPFTAAGVAE